jgi:predicted Zn finger-like uncharacterized protein
MKVVCDSCQAKYQVPDERVAGKKLKIRCKRCGATVLIRGDLLGSLESGADGELNQTLSGTAAPDMLDMSGADRGSLPPEAIALGELARGQHGMHGDEDYEWHVSLDGDTQGPFSTAALQDWLNSTPSGWEAHVWREGFPDWLDARACAELGPAPATPAMSSLQDDELPTSTFNASSYEGASFMADLAAAPRSAPRIQTQQTHATNATHQSGAYAAQQDAAYSGSYASAGSVRPVASASGATYTPGPNPGFASGEASGLIDIRALASLARQSTTQIAKTADNTGAVKNTGRASQHTGATATNGAAGAHGPNTAAHKTTGSNRPDASLSYGHGTDDDARIALAAQPSGFGRFDSLAPVSNSVSSNAALPLAILGGCALVAAAVLAAVLFNKKPADQANAPAPTHQDHQQSESAATAMPPPGEQPGMDQNKDKPKANPDQHPSGQDDEPTVAPASVEAAESDELSKAKRMRAPQPSAAAAVVAHGANEASANDADKDLAAAESKAKKEDKPAEPSTGAPEAMLAERAKPVKQAPPLTVTPLGAAEEPKPAESAKLLPEPEREATLAAAKPQPKPAPSANRSIDDLLTGATGEKPASSAAPAPAPTTTPAAAPASTQEAEDLPDSPSRDETLAAMRGVEAAVRACSANETVTGTAEVAINVAGATGRVTSATVTGITGTVGSCIARAVRNARFPRFGKPTFSIKYPYRF